MFDTSIRIFILVSVASDLVLSRSLTAYKILVGV